MNKPQIDQYDFNTGVFLEFLLRFKHSNFEICCFFTIGLFLLHTFKKNYNVYFLMIHLGPRKLDKMQIELD